MTLDAPSLLVQKPRRTTIYGDGGSDIFGDDITPPSALATVVIDPTQPALTEFYFGSAATNWPAGNYELRYLTGAFLYTAAVHPWIVNISGVPGDIFFYYNGHGAQQTLPTHALIYDTQAAVEAVFAALMPPGSVTIAHTGGTISGVIVGNPAFHAAGSPNPTFELWAA